MRNLLAHIPNGEKTMVAAPLRTIFVQPDRPAARQQVSETLRLMQRALAPGRRAAGGGRGGRAGLHELPGRALEPLYSTNPLERLNRRSGGAPRWWASFPTRTRPCGWWGRC